MHIKISLTAQTLTTEPSQQLISNTWACAADDYFWVYRGDTLKNGEKYYHCISDTVNYYDLILIPKNSSPLYDHIIWTNGLYEQTQVQNPVNKFKLFASFGTKEVMIEAKVFLNNQSQKYTLKISSKVEDKIKLEITGTKFLYDNNQKEEYYPSKTPKPKTPWQFIPTGGAIVASLNTNTWKGMKIESTDSQIVINPLKFSSKNQVIDINSNGSISGTSAMIVAGCKDTLLNIISAPMKEEIVNFYVICESDDDVQLALGPVTSDTTQCIGAGADLTIDEDRAQLHKDLPQKYPNKAPSYFDSRDSLILIQHPYKTGNSRVTYKIVAGSDKVCQTKARTQNLLCPTSNTSISSILHAANQVYNKVGVSLKIGKIDTIKWNYDVNIDDGVIESDERGLMLEYNPLFENKDLIGDTIIAFIVSDLGSEKEIVIKNGVETEEVTSTLGIATLNSRKLYVSSKGNDVYTFAHELGHSIYGFNHPDDSKRYLGGTNDPLVEDTENLMYSKAVHGSPNILRHFQCKKIHFNTY